jgi:hypothetical protein
MAALRSPGTRRHVIAAPVFPLTIARRLVSVPGLMSCRRSMVPQLRVWLIFGKKRMRLEAKAHQ